MYSLVTSFNSDYYINVARENIKLADKFWPKSSNIFLYHQLDNTEKIFSKRVAWVDLYKSCPELLEFADKWKDDTRANGKIEKKYGFKWNAIKFCHKTFAIWHAAKQINEGWLIWLDCDAIILKQIDNQFLNLACPSDKAISYIGRKNKYSECGFVCYNLNLPATRNFLKAWEDLYLSGDFVNLPQTHDSYTFDYIRNQMNQSALFHDLNANSTTDKNPFHNSVIGPYIAHAKGKDKSHVTKKLRNRINL
jgi:hypothetical protein